MKDAHITSSRVPSVQWEGDTISSTRIRNAVTQGALNEAFDMLGRRFSIWGEVVHGDGIGHSLGYPTANINPHNEVYPPEGIYAALAEIQGQSFQSAAYIGRRPTLKDNHGPWVVEAYLLDTTKDLYQSQIELKFVQKIRDDQRFPSMDALTEQISKDVEKARQLLAKYIPSIGP